MGPEPIAGSFEDIESAQERPSDDHAEGAPEEQGRHSNPLQRRLSPIDIDDLIAAYQAGATISQLADEFGIHRTTVVGHLDRHDVPRHSELTAWDDEILSQAAELYAMGLSLAEIAERFRVDAQTVADQLRRAGIAIRPRRGWPSTDTAH